MARVEAGVGRLDLAGAAVQPGRLAAEPVGATAMSSVVSYESLVHAVSGAVVSERVGARHGRREGASPQRRPRPVAETGPRGLADERRGRVSPVGSAEDVSGRLKPLIDWGVSGRAAPEGAASVGGGGGVDKAVRGAGQAQLGRGNRAVVLRCGSQDRGFGVTAPWQRVSAAALITITTVLLLWDVGMDKLWV